MKLMQPGQGNRVGVRTRQMVLVALALWAIPAVPNGGAVFATGGVNAYVCNGRDGAGGAARSDGPCFENVNRYVDCGNGTVTGVSWRAWSSTSADFFRHDPTVFVESLAWLVNLRDGQLFPDAKDAGYHSAWPVRGGSR